MSEAAIKPVKERKKPLTRFGEFELLKAIAIMGLPLVHIMEEALEAELASPALTSFGMAIIALCAFGPSVFMICMGFGIGGGKTSPDSIMRSGIQFLLIGAILNFLRWLIPGILQWIIIGEPVQEYLCLCLQSDIYYFAGTFFVAYSLLKRLKLTTASILFISFLTLTINNLLTPFIQSHVTNPYAISLLGNLIYVDKSSCFPLLSWFIFPVIGILLGEVLKKSTEEYREKFMRRMLDFSAVLLIAFVFFLYNYDIDIVKVLVSPANEYITDFPNVVLLIALALFLISVTYYVCKLIGGSKFMEFMLRISAFIIPFYLLQWIIIAWFIDFLIVFGMPSGGFNLLYFFISAIAVMVICALIATKHGMKIMKLLVKITYFKKKKKKKKTVKTTTDANK